MSYTLDPNNATWTCFGCGREEYEDGEMPDRCPECGGVWTRPVHLTSWQHMKGRIRRRFTRTRTFDSAEDLIAWLRE